MEFGRNIGFFRIISLRFGSYYTTLLKSWIKTKKRIITCNQQLIFLLRCRTYDILPSHIDNLRNGISWYSGNMRRMFERNTKHYKLRLLKLEIKDINVNLKYLHKTIANIERTLFDYLPHELLNDFLELNRDRILTFKYVTKNKLIDKFNRLLRKHKVIVNPFVNMDNSKWIINLSNKIIPDNVRDLLSLGDNFGLPIQQDCKVDRIDTALEIVKNLEVSINRIPANLRETTRISVANSVHNFLSTQKHINHIDKYILRSFVEAKNFLKVNDDMTKADKGQTTVILEKTDYIGKMEGLLNDESTYRRIDKNPVKKLTNKMHVLIKSWLDNKLIDMTTYNFLNKTNGNLPRCYGLPKIHKVDFPLRIIVSSLCSPLYNLSTYIHDILSKSIKKPRSYVKDSWSFVKSIKNMLIKDEELLISLDVASLFTNIPKDLVIKGVERRWNDIKINTTFNFSQFLYAIEFIMDSTSFVFNGQYYEQIHGSPMGSPLSPILADMVMDDLETECLEMCGFGTKLFFRYVDDIFTIIPKGCVNEILLTFNNYHPRLKFTHEIENNNMINFLNTTVIRKNGNLLTNWFLKPTCSGRYINYYSNHPFKYKKNTIFSLVDHAVLLSNECFHQANILKVKSILMNNGFPLDIVNKFVKNRLRLLRTRNNDDYINENHNLGSTKFDHIIKLPYVKNLSDDLSRLLQTTGMQSVYSIPKKLTSLIKRAKDPIPLKERTEVVYKINCENCPASYIGQTKRQLGIRVKEHFNNIKVHNSNFSVITNHKIDMRHDFDWSSPEILHHEKYVRKREIAEMFFIKKFDNNINLQKDTDNLNNVYEKLIKVV